MKIVIVGAGNLGLVCAARLAARGVDVTMFTHSPEKWPRVAIAEDCLGRHYEGPFVVTSSATCVIGANLVLLCLPGNAMRKKLSLIIPYLHSGTPIMGIFSGDGLFFIIEELLGESWPVLGFQRVPFIARTKVPYQLGGITGYKKELFLAHRNVVCPEFWRDFVETFCNTRTVLLENFYDAALVNSNVVMHPSRLMSLKKQIDENGPFERMPLFYEEWDDVASEWAICLDEEVRTVGAEFGVHVRSFLEYYESTDVQSLTRKISSIPAFRGMVSPINDAGYFDYASRYFQADVNIALVCIVNLAQKHTISCPACKEVIQKLGGRNDDRY